MLFLGQPFNLYGVQEQRFSRELLEGSWNNYRGGGWSDQQEEVSEQLWDDPIID